MTNRIDSQVSVRAFINKRSVFNRDPVIRKVHHRLWNTEVPILLEEVVDYHMLEIRRPVSIYACGYIIANNLDDLTSLNFVRHNPFLVNCYLVQE